MRYLLLILVACSTVKNPPPEPTETTAMMFFTDYMNAYEVYAVDVDTHAGGTVLEAQALGSGDGFVRAYGERLYVVTRNFQGQGNGVSVVDPTASYAVLKQFALPDESNPSDFWAVSPSKAYVIFTPFNPTSNSYALRNSVMIVNPTTGEEIKTLDLEQLMKAQGIDLAAEDTDGNFELSALHADDQHVFVAMQMYDQMTFGPRPAATDCGFVPSAVAVIDIDRDVVVDVIRLKGANPFGRFVTELGTDNLLISTVGNLSVPTVDACNGVERIDQRELALREPYLTETQVNGTIASFTVGAKGAGIGFILRGTVDDPEYTVSRFDPRGIIGQPVYAPGPKGLIFTGSATRTDRGEVYIGLPYRTQPPALHVLDLADGTAIDSIELTALPADITLFPGTAYSR